VRKTGNPWILALLHGWVEFSDQDKNNFFKHLHEFTVHDKGPAIEKINTTREEELKRLGTRIVSWGGKKIATQPLPRWQVGTQDFFWQRDVNSLDDWVGQDSPFEIYNGCDFLVCYWLGKVRGLH